MLPLWLLVVGWIGLLDFAAARFQQSQPNAIGGMSRPQKIGRGAISKGRRMSPGGGRKQATEKCCSLSEKEWRLLAAQSYSVAMLQWQQPEDATNM